MPKYKHNGFLHTEVLPGHAWHTLQTLNKGNEHELAREAWPRETERMIVVCLPPLSLSLPPSRSLSLLHRPRLQREVMYPAMRHSVKLINKTTRNLSSALKIATAKCVHWSYRLSKRGYKLPQCSRWIPNIFFSLFLCFPICLILSLFPRPVWCMIPFVCLSLYYHVVWITIITARQHQSLPVDRIAWSRRCLQSCSSQFNTYWGGD